MSDLEPPGDPVDPPMDPEPGGLRAWPVWARIALSAGVVVAMALLVVGVWQLTSSDDDATIEDVLEEIADGEQSEPPVPSTTPETTVPPTSEATTSTQASTTTSPTTTTTTTSTTTTSTTLPATTTTEATTTTVAPPPPSTSTSTTVTPSTSTTSTSTTSTSTTTTPPPTTSTTTTTTPPTTTTTTTPPPTTPPTTEPEPPPTTTPPGPTLPVAPGTVAANAREFARAWNANVAGTGVTPLSEADVTAIENGPEATTFIAVLSDQTGLVGVMRNEDQSLAEVLLVWIPGGDAAASNQRYRDAFDVLVRTVDPMLGDDERQQLGAQLGLSETAPPFPREQQATAQAGQSRYTRFVRDTRASDDTAIIGVTAAG